LARAQVTDAEKEHYWQHSGWWGGLAYLEDGKVRSQAVVTLSTEAPPSECGYIDLPEIGCSAVLSECRRSYLGGMLFQSRTTTEKRPRCHELLDARGQAYVSKGSLSLDLYKSFDRRPLRFRLDREALEDVSSSFPTGFLYDRGPLITVPPDRPLPS